jgi:hypothetical protein
MVVMALFVVILCVLIVWFGADYLLGFYFYPALLDVYSLLSFEFQTIDTVKKKIKQSDSLHIKRLLRSAPLKIVRFKEGWNDVQCFDAIVNTIIHVLCLTKKAGVMLLPFIDDEESLRHPLMRELDEDDLRRYREENKRHQALVESVAYLRSSLAKGASPEREDLFNALNKLDEVVEEVSCVQILCIKKLPFTGRPKRHKIRMVTSPSGVMTQVQ